MRKMFVALACVSISLAPWSVSGKGHESSGTAAFDKAMLPILTEYLKIQVAMAGDKITGVAAAARAIGKAVEKLRGTKVSGAHAENLSGVPDKLAAAAAALATADSLEEARERMKELSRPMAMWASMSKPKGVEVVFCSMAKGSWLQKPGPIRNPYYGASMLECGEVVQKP